jgi:hypothetical protein
MELIDIPSDGMFKYINLEKCFNALVPLSVLSSPYRVSESSFGFWDNPSLIPDGTIMARFYSPSRTLD